MFEHMQRRQIQAMFIIIEQNILAKEWIYQKAQVLP